MRICLVMGREDSDAMAIPGRFPASLAMASFYKKAGHDVSVLYADLAKHVRTQTTDEWKKRGIDVHSLAKEKAIRPESFYPDVLKESWLAYHWLNAQSYDCVFFQDDCSAGLMSIQAKKLWEAFSSTRLIYWLHGPAQWSSHLSDRRRLVRKDLVLPYSVQYGVENADHVVIPSPYFFERIRASGWRSPEHVSVLPYLAETGSKDGSDKGVGPQRGLVFPVHPSDHAALATFLQALVLLPKELGEIKLAFLCFGSRRDANDLSKRVRANLKSERGRIRCEFRAGKEAYIEQAGSLWLFSPFWLDSPALLLATADRNEILLVSRTTESEHLPGLGACLVNWKAAELARRVELYLSGKEFPQASRSGREDAEVAWNRLLLGAGAPDEEPPTSSEKEPRVTVCVAHFNKAAYLEEALTSIYKQTYPNVEVIVVDDASTDPAAQDAFKAASERFRSVGWNFIQEAENRGPGHARNEAARRASGSHLLFFDADDIAFPDMIERLVKAILQPGMDLVAGSSRRLREAAGRSELGDTNSYVGGSLENAFLHPPAGTVFLTRRDVFESVGGFKADVPHECHEDWNFHIRMLAKEYRIHVLPEPVFAYRMAPHSRTQLVTRNMGYNLEPFLQGTPQIRKNLLLFALDRAGAADAAAQMISEFDHLAGGIRMLRLFERWKRKIYRYLKWEIAK